MDPYALLKLVHVLGAVLWVGGASALTVLVAVLDRRGDDEATLTGIAQVAWMGGRVFTPVGTATILSGLVLAWLGGWGLAAWILLSAALLVGTFLLNALAIAPMCDRCLTARSDGDTATSLRLGRQVLRLVKSDLAGHVAILSLMVLKPGWSDTLLVVPAGVLAVGLLLYANGAPGRSVGQAA